MCVFVTRQLGTYEVNGVGDGATFWERAAELGDDDSMNNLGVLLKDSDLTDAWRWYERAAEPGDSTPLTSGEHITRLRSRDTRPA